MTKRSPDSLTKERRISALNGGVVMAGALLFWLVSLLFLAVDSLVARNYSACIFLLTTCAVSLLLFIPYMVIYTNFLIVSTEHIRHRKQQYRWEDVCVTLVWSGVPGSRGDAYFAYFDDHFLAEEELKAAKKNKFYMQLTAKRVDLLLSLYPGELRILNKSRPSRYARKMEAVFQAHNERVQAAQQTTPIE